MGKIVRLYHEDKLLAELSEDAVIGREDTCHVRIDDAFASRQHGKVEFRRNGVYIRDLDSTNGIFIITPKGDRAEPLTPYLRVDSDKVKRLVRKPERLQSGDILLIGTTEIRVEILDVE